MADLAHLTRPTQRLRAALHWYHVDKRKPLPGDDGYDMVEVPSRISSGPGLDFRVGVKSALEDELVYVVVPPTGILARQVFEQRSIWFQLAWRR
jgi:hypothetical protein